MRVECKLCSRPMNKIRTGEQGAEEWLCTNCLWRVVLWPVEEHVQLLAFAHRVRLALDESRASHPVGLVTLDRLQRALDTALIPVS
jgi:hypothetical protein